MHHTMADDGNDEDHKNLHLTTHGGLIVTDKVNNTDEEGRQ